MQRKCGLHLPENVVNNISNIPTVALRNIVRIIEARSDEVKQKWFEYFGEIRYFC